MHVFVQLLEKNGEGKVTKTMRRIPDTYISWITVLEGLLRSASEPLCPAYLSVAEKSVTTATIRQGLDQMQPRLHHCTMSDAVMQASLLLYADPSAWNCLSEHIRYQSSPDYAKHFYYRTMILICSYIYHFVSFVVAVKAY